MSFFNFSQNNSGGSFITDEKRGLGVEVFVEALNADEANDRAERIGIYFNGCEQGRDCSCCGDRWYPAWGDEKGDPEPMLYGKPAAEEGDRAHRWKSAMFVHYRDGTFKKIGAGK